MFFVHCSPLPSSPTCARLNRYSRTRCGGFENINWDARTVNQGSGPLALGLSRRASMTAVRVPPGIAKSMGNGQNTYKSGISGQSPLAPIPCGGCYVGVRGYPYGIFSPCAHWLAAGLAGSFPPSSSPPSSSPTPLRKAGVLGPRRSPDSGPIEGSREWSIEDSGQGPAQHSGSWYIEHSG